LISALLQVQGRQGTGNLDRDIHVFHPRRIFRCPGHCLPGSPGIFQEGKILDRPAYPHGLHSARTFTGDPEQPADGYTTFQYPETGGASMVCGRGGHSIVSLYYYYQYTGGPGKDFE